MEEDLKVVWAMPSTANKYKEVFGDKVNIYCMVIPTAVEFYCPDKVKKRTNQQLPTIRNVVAHLNLCG